MEMLTSYQQIKKKNVRSRFRNLILSLLSPIYVPYRKKILQRPRIHILLLHYLFSDIEENFVSWVEYLRNTGHTFISYSEAVDRVTDGIIDKPYICFTFDDGLQNCLKAGEILNKYGASACFFVNGKMIGERRIDKLSAFCKHRLRRIAPTSFLSWADIDHLLELGHEIGGHTYSHVNLAELDRYEIEEELRRNKSILEKYVGPVKHFAWPYGHFRHFSLLARECVYEAGYHTCASGIRGAHVTKANNRRFCIRRESISAGWPLDHLKFFLVKSAVRSTEDMNSWLGLEEMQI